MADEELNGFREKYIIFCKNYDVDGLCKIPRLTYVKAKDKVEHVAHTCLFTINDLQLNMVDETNRYQLVIPDKKQGDKVIWYGCRNFEPLNNLEKILTLVGDLKFSNEDYLCIEDDDYYYMARQSPEFIKQTFKRKKK